jgi:hypothetical protein
MMFEAGRLQHAGRITAAALALAAIAGSAGAVSEGPQTRALMAEIFEALRRVLPLSLAEASFRAPEHRQEVLAALSTLADGGARLEEHGARRSESFAFLSRSLARDVREIRDRYAADRYEEARFLLHELTEDCVSCHSRLPSDRDSPLSERFVREEAVSQLPLQERAVLEMATRQFERALVTYESLFASPETSPSSLDLRGDFDDYLEVCIRVRGDFERPRQTLEAVAQRSDSTADLRRKIAHWTDSLRELGPRTPDPSPLAEARKLLLRAEDRERFPEERSALVFYVAASSVLHRFVDTSPPALDGAEAYYRLGVIESRVGRSFWLSQTEAYLETAIRLAPGGPLAEDAFALLEEFIVASYSGSTGVHVPQEARDRLAELQGLIDGS